MGCEDKTGRTMINEIPENEKKDKKDVTTVTKIVMFDLKVTFSICILFKQSPSTDLKALIFIHNKDIYLLSPKWTKIQWELLSTFLSYLLLKEFFSS